MACVHVILVWVGRHEHCHVCVPALVILLGTTVQEAAVAMSHGCRQPLLISLSLASHKDQLSEHEVGTSVSKHTFLSAKALGKEEIDMLVPGDQDNRPQA